jgi:hypothetical protein
VSVTSDNGTILYSGESTQAVGPPTFRVNLTLAAVAPVLQVCPGHMLLDRSTRFTETVRVLNRGLGTLTYEAVTPMCERGPCVEFRVPTGTALPDPGSLLSASFPRMTTQTSLELRVQSPVGSVPIAVTLGLLPDLVVDTLFATDTAIFTNHGVEQPVRVVIRNVGNATAGIFKVAAEYTDIKGLSVGRFLVIGQTDSTYSYTQNPLLPGAEVTLDGKIIFLFAGGRVPVMLRLHADSCRGDELAEAFCRVDEFDEGNNVSADLAPFS